MPSGDALLGGRKDPSPRTNSAAANPPVRPQHGRCIAYLYFPTIHQKRIEQALEMAGDERLSAVAREALPANKKTSKKAVELMGSTKVVTEKKALKRLGSEMTESMRVLQLKTERKQQREEEQRRANVLGGGNLAAGLGGEGGGTGGEGGAADGIGALGEKSRSSGASMVNMRVGSPSSFTASPMARRATRLLTEVPKFITEMGMGSGGSKADLVSK